MTVREVRLAARTLWKTPAFTLAAVAALALGIGANTAIFSVIQAVLLRPLPYPDSDRIVQLVRRYPGSEEGAITASKFAFWMEQSTSFASMAAYDVLGSGFNLTGDGDPERVRGIRVSHGFFDVLGVQPALGRSFTAEEDRPGVSGVAVLSHGLWQRRFGGDPAIIGRSIAISGESYEVAGVMPRGFWHVPEADLWLPIRLQQSTTKDLTHAYVVLARLKQAVTPERANEELRAVVERYRKASPVNMPNARESAGVVSYQQGLVGDVRPALLAMACAVGLVLLIACANVANLLLARSTVRQKEMAIRAGLGAGRGRIVRQLLTESVVLALAGGAAGLLVAQTGLEALRQLASTRLPRFAEISMDTGVLLFTAGLSVLTGIVFGLAPAFAASRLDLAAQLREGGRGTAGAGRPWVRGLLVAAETAMATVLLIGAALLLETFSRLRDVNPGFDPTGVLTMRMSLGGSRYQTTGPVADLYRRVLERVEALPGVAAAATVTTLPLELGPDLPFEVAGRPEGAQGSSGNGQWRAIMPHYFRVMRIKIRQGREFNERDAANAAPVILINEAMVRRLWPKGSPLGERIIIGRQMGPDLRDAPREIVGVVADVNEYGLDKPAPETLFVPAPQVPDNVTAVLNRLLPTTWVVRAHGDPLAMRTVVEGEIRAVERDNPLSEIRSMEQVVGESITRQRFNMILAGAFAAIAALLAAVGIYGVMSYSVSRRSQEIGIRMALGARQGSVVALVLREGLGVSLAGLAVGLGMSLWLTRLISGLLFGVRPAEPWVFAAVSALLASVALAACLLPAWRASKIDPVIALRES